jgi:hypothetical protein
MNSTNAAEPHWRSWLLDKSKNIGNITYSLPEPKWAKREQQSNPVELVDRVDGSRDLDVPLELQDRSGRLELGIGLGTDRRDCSDTDNDDQGEHHRVFNGGWPIFRDHEILDTVHELVHRDSLSVDTELVFRTRNSSPIN